MSSLSSLAASDKVLAMAHSWHISDWNSFPMQSHQFPELWFGAFSAYERYDSDCSTDEASSPYPLSVVL